MTKNNLTIQEKITQLDALVAWFDSDEFVLEQAIEKFTASEALARSIEDDLNALKNDIQLVKQKFDVE